MNIYALDRERLCQHLNIALGRAGSSTGPFRFRALPMESDHGWFGAQLDDGLDGIGVTIFERKHGACGRSSTPHPRCASWHLAMEFNHLVNHLTRSLV